MRRKIKMEKAKVYFSKEITPESVVKMYEILRFFITRKGSS